jgi:hypothetical protein
MELVCVLDVRFTLLLHADPGGLGRLKLELDWVSRLTWTSLLFVSTSTSLSKYFSIFSNVPKYDNIIR